MSTAAVSSSSIYQELQAYFQQRSTDVQQLGQDLSSGNLANAEQDFNALQTLGQSGPSAKGDVFESSQREQDFTAIGQALQSGNLSAAQQAFAQLQSTFHQNANAAASTASAATASAATASASTASASTAPSSSGSSIYQQLQAFYQQRNADVQQLGQDLTSGNVANAEQDFNNLQTLGQSGPFKSGDPFNNNQSEQDFSAIGQALQSGNLSGAQQDFAQLESTSHNHHRTSPVSVPPNIPAASAASSSGSTSAAGAGTEIILNLANAPAGEQISIGLTNESNGNEQVAISASSPQNQTPEQILLNVNPNTNQQIFLNLFGPSVSSTPPSSLNTTA